MKKRFIVTWLQTRNLEPNISMGENDYKSTLSWNDKGDRPLGNSIGVLLGSQPLLYCCEGWGIPILNPNGHTELTVGRPCSGKHVIEVSVIRKATWWILWKRKAVRICTFKKVNCSMTDVATIHFKQILERLGEKPQSVTKSF